MYDILRIKPYTISKWQKKSTLCGTCWNYGKEQKILKNSGKSYVWCASSLNNGSVWLSG